MESMRVAMDRKMQEIEAGDIAELDPAKALNLQKEMARALAIATEAEGRAYDARCEREGGGGLDFGAAEAEIRRRLAVLRGSRHDGGVPPGT